jgi:hypothetical protein
VIVIDRCKDTPSWLPTAWEIKESDSALLRSGDGLCLFAIVYKNVRGSLVFWSSPGDVPLYRIRIPECHLSKEFRAVEDAVSFLVWLVHKIDSGHLP